MNRIVLLISCVLLCGYYAISQDEPSSPPDDLTFDQVKPWQIRVSFDPSDGGASGYLVVQSKSPVSFVPQDNVGYEKGQAFSGDKIISNGPSLVILSKEVYAETEYYYAIYAYNTLNGDTNYLESMPLLGSTFSGSTNPGNYYEEIETTSPTFIQDLRSLINPHTFVAYSNYNENIVPNVFERDTIGGQHVVTCEYSGEHKIYTGDFSFTSDPDYSREHRLPQSWMPSGGGTGNIEGADYHNLALTNLNNANTRRSNHPLGEVETVTFQYLQGKLGYDSNGDMVYEPKDAQKGDAARAIFYMMAAYNGLGGSWSLQNLDSQGSDQSLSTLLQWHQQDPPDAFEKTKHEYIYSIQNNRNPFIDFPDWIGCMHFNTLQKNTANCPNAPQVSVKEVNKLAFKLYPNPAQTEVQVLFDNFQDDIQVSITDLLGKEIPLDYIEYTKQGCSISVEHLSEGSYWVHIKHKNRTYTNVVHIVD